MDMQVSHEQSQRFADNEISSRWGRALFSVVFDGGLTAVGGIIGFKVAEVISESGASEAAGTVAGLGVGIGIGTMLKRIGRR